jgi:hypothetical protein
MKITNETRRAAEAHLAIQVSRMPWTQRKARLENASTYAEVCTLSTLQDSVHGVNQLVARVCGVVSHRNGVDGQPFHTVVFFAGAAGDGKKMIATIFDCDVEREGILSDRNPYCAVVLVDEVASGDVESCFRGDNYAPFISAIVRISQR